MTNQPTHNAYKNRQPKIVNETDELVYGLALFALQIVFIFAIFTA
jgi:hypothetical protein